MSFPVDEPRKAWVSWMAGALVALAIGALVVWAVTSFKGSGGGRRQQMVKIAVLPDTPPPPPKEEKKPEPEKREDKPQPQQEQQPKPQVAPPEPQQLKMEGPTGDAPSAFSGGSVTQEYKGGDVGTGAGGGALQFTFFTNQLQRHMQGALARNRDIKLGDYKVSISVWLSPSGEFKKVELLTPSGDEKVDAALRQAFMQIPPMSDVPASLPQPIRLRITNRMTG
ncbi:MAG: TonB C-terminal domain-containing protein [Massilia sp.]|nr:TonB C-terminal domain-containing protein [Aquabacterium sp.]